MSRKPRIAVIMDENTAAGGSGYEMPKTYFTAVHRAGGMPFGIPYLPDMVESVIAEFDGFVSVGGRIRFPADWYAPGDGSRYPSSERLEVEQALMRGFLDLDKPVQFRAFALADQYRVVVDLPQVNFQLPAGVGIAGRGLVKAFRYGLVMPGGSRIVFDLAGPAKIGRASCRERV